MAIRFENVGKTFAVRGGESFTALDDISLDVDDGEFLVVVGPSGCGKSTLLDLLGGLAKPTSGRITLDGVEVTGPGLDRGIVFQQYALLPWRTALRNVEFGLEAQPRTVRLSRRARADRAREFLELVGLAGFEDRYPHELSGGMRQRVAIARSLAFDPDVLLMDEPFAALDAQTRDALQEELLRIWEATGKTIVFITHGIDEAVYLGQRVAVMTSRPGRIKEIVEIGLGTRRAEDDVRSSPEFTEYRHRVWSLLHDEVDAAARLERGGGSRRQAIVGDAVIDRVSASDEDSLADAVLTDAGTTSGDVGSALTDVGTTSGDAGAALNDVTVTSGDAGGDVSGGASGGVKEVVSVG